MSRSDFFLIARFGREGRKLISFFLFFYLFGLSSEDLCSLTELRLSTAFYELWPFSVKFLSSGFSRIH